MKFKLLYLLLLVSSFAYGQKTKAQLKTLFDQIRNETATGANTNQRVANAFQYLADASEPIIASSSTTGTNSYVADPGISSFTGYIKGQIFAIQFVNSNTGSTVTVDLGGNGAKNVKKPGGALSLGAGDIVAGATYLIWYNGTSFEVLNLPGSGGGGGESTFASNVTFVLSGSKSFGHYTNGQTAAWSGLTARQAILDASVEYINPSWNSFSVSGTGIASTVEVGVTMPSSATATWSITANSGVVSTIDIKDVTAATTLVTNTPNDGTQVVSTATLQLNSNGATQVWKGTLHDTGAVTQNIDSNPFTVTARFKAFFDEVSAFPTNSAQVRALTQSQFVSGSTTIDLAIGTSGTKRVMCLPPGFTVTHVSDVNNLGNDITANYILTTISVLDAGGTSRTYNVYKDSDASPYPSATIHRFTIN